MVYPAQNISTNQLCKTVSRRRRYVAIQHTQVCTLGFEFRARSVSAFVLLQVVGRVRPAELTHALSSRRAIGGGKDKPAVLALADVIEQERIPFLDHACLRPVATVGRLTTVTVVAFGALLVHRRQLRGFKGGGRVEGKCGVGAPLQLCIGPLFAIPDSTWISSQAHLCMCMYLKAYE